MGTAPAATGMNAARERELHALGVGEILFRPEHRVLYSTAACIFRQLPQGVVAPRDETQVSRLLAWAEERGIAVTPRGGGSSLSGAAIGTGLVLDLARHMRRLGPLDLDRELVTASPGVTLAELNRFLAPHGKFFPPDPSSGDFCTLGGMVGTSASGPHTVKYGSTREHVHSLRLVLAGGEILTARPLDVDGAEFRSREKSGSRWARALATLKSAVEGDGNQELIRRHTPRVGKNSCGYHLLGIRRDGMLDPLPLLIGSEGTLGVVTEMTLRIRDLPAARRAALFYLRGWEEASHATLALLPHGPAAVELMDQDFLGIVRAGRPELAKLIPAEGKSALLVEFEGTEDECRHLVKEAEEELRRRGLLQEVAHASSAEEAERLWSVRRAALPLVYRRPGREKPLNFIDDGALPTENLPAYARGVERILSRAGVRAFLFGHAADGNVHVTPMIDPWRPDVGELLNRIAGETHALAIELGGTISGEHGDGILRAPWVRAQYGPLWEVMNTLKRSFDPAGILNPGRILSDARAIPVEHLRFLTQPRKTYTVFDGAHWQRQIDLCHGCGTCRDYCPVAAATAEEEATGRGKANLLAGILRGELPPDVLHDRDFKRLMDLCVDCDLCLTRCPTGVDIPGLARKAREAYMRHHGPTLRDRMLGKSDLAGRVGSIAPGTANLLVRNPLLRGLAERLWGISARRELPPLARPLPTSDLRETSGPAGGAGVSMGETPSVSRRVAYFAGCFGRYHEPEKEGEATLEVLRRNGVETLVPPHRCCGIALNTLGMTEEARESARRNVEMLVDLVARGFAVVASAPSCAVALRHRYPELLETEEARLVAGNTWEIHEYLEALQREGKLSLELGPIARRVVYHEPCHGEALGVGDAPQRILSLIPELEIVPIRDVCCGMAGTFGMKREHFDLSMAMGEPLFKEIAAAGVDTVVTGCGTCQLQLRQGTGCRAVHPLFLLAESYRAWKPS